MTFWLVAIRLEPITGLFVDKQPYDMLCEIHNRFRTRAFNKESERSVCWHSILIRNSTPTKTEKTRP
jgi:hypothetical protein